MTESSIGVLQRMLFLLRRIVLPLKIRLQTILSSGLTPKKLAITICMGAALGLLPVVWGTTLICLMLAHIFKLNHAALQSINYLLYPLQLALLIPFFKLGAWLFPWGPQVDLNTFSSLIHHPAMSSFNILGWITLKSVAAWFVTALPLALLAYIILRAVASKKSE